MLDDAAVERALARVVDPDGRTLGTAFFVSPHLAITCDHVVAGRSIEIDQAGHRYQATHVVDEAAAGIDIALIKVADRTSNDVLVLDPHAPATFPFWSTGFQFASGQLRDSYPIRGEIVGRTSIAHGDYQLDGVLVLAQGEVDEGMSGAPVVAIDEGTAIGVVDARFKRPAQPAAFAIAMAEIIRRVPRVESLYVEQRRTVPQTGRVLNAVGARRACAEQRLRAVLRLERADRYLRDRDVPRRALEEGLDEFVTGTARMCAVVGPSSSGKTTALVGYVSRRPEQPLLLVSASRLADHDPSLKAMLHTELGEQPEAIAQAVRSAGERMIVVLDGWNEAPASVLQAGESWVEREIDWLEEADVRLIVSSRPEHWSTYSELFPRRFFPRSTNQGEPRPALLLGNFTAEETRQAERAYGLGRTELLDRLRHPLMVRIFAEVRHEAMQPGLYDGVDSWIDFKCRAVARRVTDFGPNVVREGLRATIAAMVERPVEPAHGQRQHVQPVHLGSREARRLPLATFRSLFHHEPRIGYEVMRENVIEEVGQSVRFAFDDVAELLESERIDPALLGEPEALSSTLIDSSGPSLGSLTFAILRLEREPKVAFETAAGILAEAALSSAGFPATICFLDVLQGARDPTRLQTALGRLTETDDDFTAEAIIAALRTTALPVAVSLRVTRRLARLLTSFGWRTKDWPLGLGVLNRFDKEAWQLVDETMVRSPHETITELAQWLDDDSKLADGEGKISDVGARMLYRWFDREPATAAELLAVSRAHVAVVVLGLVAVERPQTLLPSLARWVSEGDSRRQYLASTLLGAVYSSDVASRPAVIDLAVALERSAEPNIAFLALQALAQFAETRATAVPRLLKRMLTAGMPVTGYDLWPSLEHDWRSVLDAVEQLGTGGRYADVSVVLLGVADWEGPEEFRGRVVEILAGLPDQAINSAYAQAVVRVLGRCAGGTLPPGILDLPARVIEVGGPSARTYLIYFSTAASENRRAERLRHQVRDLLLAREDDRGNVVKLIDRWLSSLRETGRKSQHGAVAKLLALAARAAPDAPEQLFIHAVANRGDLLPLIRDNWLLPASLDGHGVVEIGGAD